MGKKALAAEAAPAKARSSEPSNLAGDPLSTWFTTRGWRVLPFQREVWRRYLAGESGLLHTPTGSGKTLAAFGGPLLEALAHEHHATDAKARASIPRLRVLWITPLRALANDTVRALREPIDALGLGWTVAMRTGDAGARDRRLARSGRADALVTTPESLALLLSYPDAAPHLAGLRAVVVDEWHELLGNKRGVLLQLCLARLRALAHGVRTWGLSATLGNLAQARDALLAPSDDGAIVSGVPPRALSIETLMPAAGERFPWAGHLGLVQLQRVMERLLSVRTSLLFTNTRAQAELWHRALAAVWPEAPETLALHHGSLDPALRAAAETSLRDGSVRCVVATSSLDLGVDFPAVDQVLQVGSPKGMARLLQRSGRARHRPGEAASVVCVPTHALELVEYAAARQALAHGRIESRPPPTLSLDVLAQHCVTLALGGGPGGRMPDRSAPRVEADAVADDTAVDAVTAQCPTDADVHASARDDAVSVDDSLAATASRLWWSPDEQPARTPKRVRTPMREADASPGFDADALFAEVRNTYAFAALDQATWRSVLDFIVQGGNALAHYPEYTRAVRGTDGRYRVENRRIAFRHRLNIGTIASDGSVAVKYMKGGGLGSVEESFVGRLRPGDRFQFAGRTLELVRLQDMTAYVRVSRRMDGMVPKWQGGRMPLSSELGREVERVLGDAPDAPELRAIAPLLALQARLSALPAADRLLVEWIKARDGWHLFVYPFAGRAVHEGLASLMSLRWGRRQANTFSFAANDYGFMLSPARPAAIDAQLLRALLSPDNLIEDLRAGLNLGELARRQFREVARVAGLLPPSLPGRAARSRRQLQASSGRRFDVLQRYDPDHLLLAQAEREVLSAQLELERLAATLADCAGRALALRTPSGFTPLSFPLWAESLRGQLSTEDWKTRVERAAAMLERRHA